ESLHTPFLSPYLKALGADFSNGVNFAIGGSTATPGGSPFSLDVQLHQWLYFRARSMEMINLEASHRSRRIPKGHLHHRHRAERRVCLHAPALRPSACQDPWICCSDQVHHRDAVLARGPQVLDPRHGRAGLPAAEAGHPAGRRRRRPAGRPRLPQDLQQRRQALQRAARRRLRPAPAPDGGRGARLRRHVRRQVRPGGQPHDARDRETSHGVLRLRRAAVQLQPLQGVHVGGDAAVRRGHALHQLGRRALHGGRQRHRRRQGAHRRLLHAQGHHRQTRQLHAAQRRLAGWPIDRSIVVVVILINILQAAGFIDPYPIVRRNLRLAHCRSVMWAKRCMTIDYSCPTRQELVHRPRHDRASLDEQIPWHRVTQLISSLTNTSS
ncbi:hypothetical protein ACJX0J_016132, partial [Zea mays]